MALAGGIHQQQVAIGQVDGEGELAISERIARPGPEAQRAGGAEAVLGMYWVCPE